MSIVFNKNNPIVGKDGIGAVIDLIKNNSNGIDGIAQSLGEIGDDIDSLDDRIETLENDSESLTHRVTVVEADLQTVNDDMRDKADVSTVNALTERVSTVEAEVQDRPDYSEFNPVANDVQTLNDSYDNIVNTLNQEINELIDGKAMIASALTDRGYPTQATDSSASMAQKITDMEYGAGWLAQLGYDEQSDGGVKDAVAYSKAIKDGWNPTKTTRRFANDQDLVFFPDVDTSQYTTFESMFEGCDRLVSFSGHPIASDLVTSTKRMFYPKDYNKGNALIKSPAFTTLANVTTAERMYQGCSQLKEIPVLNTSNTTNFIAFMWGCANLVKVYGLDLASLASNGNIGSFADPAPNSPSIIQYMLLKNIGTKSTFTSLSLRYQGVWGYGNEENRQSLVDSLLTYSFDRAAAGYSTCTITLHAGTLARLTNEEIAAITAKGYTLTS